MKKDITIVDQSRDFDITEKFFSITDDRGTILCGNDVFTRVSGYEPNEILNKPHNTIRHPDMPRCIFDLFWKYLKEGKVIGTYVKNLAKDGKYYWVYALVSPFEDKFFSIRIKPTSETFPVVEALYKELAEHEANFAGNRQDAMKSAGELLEQRLVDLNYADYDEFMYDTLRRELKLHDDSIGDIDFEFINAGTKQRADNIKKLYRVFTNLERLSECGKAIKAKQTCFLTLERDLHAISTNTKFRASRLENSGRTLIVISDEISRTRADIDVEITRLTKDIENITNAITGITLHSSLGLMQVQAQQSFDEEKNKSRDTKSEQVARYGLELNAISTILEQTCNASLEGFSKEIKLLSRALAEFEEFILFLSRMIQILDFSYVTGESLSASIDNADEFRDILAGLKIVANKSSEDLTELRKLVVEVSVLIE